MSENSDNKCKGDCNREAFVMPPDCPPIDKPPIVDVIACRLPDLIPTDFERHPLVVDMPTVPLDVNVSCIDIKTNLKTTDDKEAENSMKFRQASGADDCVLGLYALDLELAIPTCSTDPPVVTGEGSRGIVITGKGVPRHKEMCMFDFELDMTVPCPLEDISIGDGKGIARIEKGIPPSFSNCQLSFDVNVPCPLLDVSIGDGKGIAKVEKTHLPSPQDCSMEFDVNVPCPLPGITFIVTGQASGSLATGASKKIEPAKSGSSWKLNGATGATGGSPSGGGGGSSDCTLELRLNVPCQLPGVSFTVRGIASGGIVPKPPTPSGPTGSTPCETALEINVPCQLPNVTATKLASSTRAKVRNGKGTIVELNEAFKVFASKKHNGIIPMSLSTSGSSGEGDDSNDCSRDIQITVPDIELPCHLSTGLATGATVKPSNPNNVKPLIDLSKAIRLVKEDESSSNDCKAVLKLEADNLTVPCQKLDLNLTGNITGNVAPATGCDETLSLNVPCQLDLFKADITGQASGEIRADTTSSNDCAKQLVVDVPCQLDIIEVKETVKPATGPGSAANPIVPANNNGVISLSEAVKLKREPAYGQHRSDSCDMSLQIEAGDISVPCEGLKTSTTGQVTASFSKDTASGANPCDKVLSINVPCQLDKLTLNGTDVSGEETTSSDGVVDTTKIVYPDTKTGNCSGGVTLNLARKKFRVPIEKVVAASNDVISVTPSDSGNIKTYTVSTTLKKRKLYIPTEFSFGIADSSLKITVKKTGVDVYSDAAGDIGTSTEWSGSVPLSSCSSS